MLSPWPPDVVSFRLLTCHAPPPGFENACVAVLMTTFAGVAALPWMIGGSAPSKYLAQIQGHSQVTLADSAMDSILMSHMIEPALLRADAFQEFYASRRAALLAIVERAMGKASAEATTVVANDDEDDEEDAEIA